MDTTDRQLLDALRSNARATYAELARVVGLSAPAVHERVSKLESNGVITGYHAAVAPESLGYSMSALIGVNMSDNANVDAIASALSDVVQVEDLWLVAGDESYIAKVRVADIGGLGVAMRAVNDVPGVRSTKTTVVIETKFEGRVQSADTANGQ
ncbi:AsnC family transcriptional regulator [Jatrophihabitans sp. GAS493]|uniref:Lrp/AsnC family transcriptional regulator n=1 Tax=Jatrophihabitans sp. GAS493 TaxID=1907575 RepID=UPI000BB7138F|nr:Lrp/AsnC family transcriptional regulator [Jatrophihabitans sp. GAS493]SOD70609.1 AsnC family transcriptional regulator [Jatrophihabitans sp. GAS493]